MVFVIHVIWKKMHYKLIVILFERCDFEMEPFEFIADISFSFEIENSFY